MKRITLLTCEKMDWKEAISGGRKTCLGISKPSLTVLKNNDDELGKGGEMSSLEEFKRRVYRFNSASDGFKRVL